MNEMNEILLHADESANVVVLHSDASTSRVEVKIDDTTMMTVVIDANPTIPYGLLIRAPHDGSDLTTTEQVLASAEFDEEAKAHLLWAMMTGTCCPSCAEEAHQALHALGILDDADDIPDDAGTFEPDLVSVAPTRDGLVRLEIPDGDDDSIVLGMTAAEAQELVAKISQAAEKVQPYAE